MLTWAIVSLSKAIKVYNGFWLVIAMVCDVLIFNSLAEFVRVLR